MSHDFQILIVVDVTPQPDEVEQQREDVCQEKEGHGRRCCREYAERRSGTDTEREAAPAGLKQPRTDFPHDTRRP